MGNTICITPNRYFFRQYKKEVNGSIKEISDYCHLKAIVGKGKFMGTVVGSHKSEKEIIDLKTLDGAVEVSKFEFESVLKEMKANG